MMSVVRAGGQHSTEVALALLTKQPLVRISVEISSEIFLLSTATLSDRVHIVLKQSRDFAKAVVSHEGLS